MKALLSCVLLVGISGPLIASAIEPSDYPAVPYHGRLAAPKLVSRQAKLYRTVLREGAARGANFAGRYALIPIGEGTSTELIAVVDEISGAVSFPKQPGLVTWTACWRNPCGPVFEIGSRLLRVYGQAGSEDAPVGVSYFVWEGAGFKLIKFEARDLGHPPAEAQQLIPADAR